MVGGRGKRGPGPCPVFVISDERGIVMAPEW